MVHINSSPSFIAPCQLEHGLQMLPFVYSLLQPLCRLDLRCTTTETSSADMSLRRHACSLLPEVTVAAKSLPCRWQHPTRIATSVQARTWHSLHHAVQLRGTYECSREIRAQSEGITGCSRSRTKPWLSRSHGVRPRRSYAVHLLAQTNSSVVNCLIAA